MSTSGPEFGFGGAAKSPPFYQMAGQKTKRIVSCFTAIHSCFCRDPRNAAIAAIEFAGYEMLKGLEGIKTHETSHWIPIFENTQDIPALASKVQHCLTDIDQPLTHGFLIRKHGLYAWGRDTFAARRHIEIYEFLFECLARKIRLDP